MTDPTPRAALLAEIEQWEAEGLRYGGIFSVSHARGLLERAAAEIRALQEVRRRLDVAKADLAAMEQFADETYERVVDGIHKELDALGIPNADPEYGIAGKGHLLRIQDALAALRQDRERLDKANLALALAIIESVAEREAKIGKLVQYANPSSNNGVLYSRRGDLTRMRDSILRVTGDIADKAGISALVSAARQAGRTEGEQ